MPSFISPAAEPPDHRSRLLDGMAAAVAVKGYAQATIADIVAEAGVSRRTFYEHFTGKPACFIALYERANRQGLAVLARGLDPALPWQQQVDQALKAYLTWMASHPVLIRTLVIDILGLGVAGLAARRRAHTRMADFILTTINQPTRQTLPRAVALALIGGVHELVLERVEAGAPATVTELAPVAAHLARRLLSA